MERTNGARRASLVSAARSASSRRPAPRPFVWDPTKKRSRSRRRSGRRPSDQGRRSRGVAPGNESGMGPRQQTMPRSRYGQTHLYERNRPFAFQVSSFEDRNDDRAVRSVLFRGQSSASMRSRVHSLWSPNRIIAAWADCVGAATQVVEDTHFWRVVLRTFQPASSITWVTTSIPESFRPVVRKRSSNHPSSTRRTLSTLL